VKKALEHEIARQERELAAGGRIVQETRLWDADAGQTRPMRSKEEAMDYRYFPDPDLGALEVGAAWLEEVRASMPELPEARAARFVRELALPAADAELLAAIRPLADYYEAAVAEHRGNPKALANWILSELLAGVSDADRQAGRLPVPAAHLAQLVKRIDDGTISGKIAKELLPDVVASGRTPDELIAEKGLVQVTDEAPIRAAVDEVLAASPQQVATYRAGKAATLGWFVGQVMKATRGKASPAVVNRLLKEALDR
jgi:aspartyl-tRNA(Asn)/glutamyl-tRNA(Gln) amidotransferase subunit B